MSVPVMQDDSALNAPTPVAAPAVFAMFPGQGSQKVGMGRALFDSFDTARELFNRADEVLGIPLSRLCFEGPEGDLTLTAHAQPALLTVSTICFQLSSQHFRVIAAAGHSLGEYSALVAAEALSFEDAVRLVHLRGRYMQEAVSPGAGKMVAVLGKEVDEIEHALAQVSNGTAEIANINAPGQVVVSGDVEGIRAFTEALGTAKVVELSVSAPFHSSLMGPAAERLATDLEQVEIRPPKFPVISNFSAQPLSDPSEIRRALHLQVCGRVRWVESVQYVLNHYSPRAAIEFGTGTTLVGLLKRTAPSLKGMAVDSPSRAEEVASTLA